MVDSRQKGARAESVIRDALRKATGHQFERVPGSGALDPKHKLKGDLYIPDSSNKYAIEVKHYCDDHLTSKLLTSKNSQLIEWWEQAERQGKQVGREPLLIFKFDRSKIFVGFAKEPTQLYDYILINVDDYTFYVAELDVWLNNEKPVFI